MPSNRDVEDTEGKENQETEKKWQKRKDGEKKKMSWVPLRFST